MGYHFRHASAGAFFVSRRCHFRHADRCRAQTFTVRVQGPIGNQATRPHLTVVEVNIAPLTAETPMHHGRGRHPHHGVIFMANKNIPDLTAAASADDADPVEVYQPRQPLGRATEGDDARNPARLHD